MSGIFKLVFTGFVALLFSVSVYSQDGLKTTSGITKVVILGSGTPYPSPTESGPATVITYGKRVFLFDAGAGAMRQMNAAHLPISGPEATFITHLHTDHTLGYPDLIFTTWIMRSCLYPLKS